MRTDLVYDLMSTAKAATLAHSVAVVTKTVSRLGGL
jgi:hypothetical protein